MTRKTRTIVCTVLIFALLALAAGIALSGGSALAAAGSALAALLVALAAPSILGSPGGRAIDKRVDAAAVRQWRIDHPDATIAEAVDAVGRRDA